MFTLPLIDKPDRLPELPALLAQTGGEFAVSPMMNAGMVAEVCRHGYLPMADQFQGHPLLLIKSHHRRMVLNFERLYVSRSTLRRIRRSGFSLSLDRQFDEAIAGIDRHHEQSWLVPSFLRVLRELHRTPRHGVSVHSVELTDAQGGLVAAEVGYRCGTVYTSLSGFHRVSGAGTVQITALARLLERQGFAFWDLGMEIPYKRRLGAVSVPREEFLHLYRRAVTRESAPFPRTPVECRSLLEGYARVAEHGEMLR